MKCNTANEAKHMINTALNEWDFEKVHALYENNKNFAEIQMDFACFLNSIGDIRGLHVFLAQGNHNKPLVCPSFWDEKKFDWQTCYETIQKSLESDKTTLYKQLQNNKYINPNFLLNEFIQDDTLNAIIALELIEQHVQTTKNAILRNYFLKTALHYFCNTTSEKQREFFGRHSTSMPFASFLVLFTRENTNGSNKHYAICIKQYRTFLLQECSDIADLIPHITPVPHKPYKKFAICLYGILRGDYKATLEDIITKLALPLNADVFLFTWDRYQVWPGTCGWSSWVLRLLDPSLHERFQDEITFNASLYENFPHVYEKIIETDYQVTLNKKDIESFQKTHPCLKDYAITNQDSIQYEGKEKGGGYHLYYGIHRALNLMQEYEKTHNTYYDFIFTLRCDGDIVIHGKQEQVFQDLQKCANNEIFDSLYEMGASNIAMYGPRSVMLALSSLYSFVTKLPTHIFPAKYYNHMLTCAYLTMCGVEKNRDTLIDQRHTGDNKCYKGFSFPDVTHELCIDLENLTKQKRFNKIKMASFSEAIEEIEKLYPRKHLEGINIITTKQNKTDKKDRLWLIGAEEVRYISPNELALPLKVMRFVGRYFPNSKVRRSVRKLINLFSYTYKKVYGKEL